MDVGAASQLLASGFWGRRPLLDLPSVTHSEQNIADVTALRSMLEVTASGKVAQVVVTVDIVHDHTGDLDIALFSPGGTRSQFASPRNSVQSNANYWFNYTKSGSQASANAEVEAANEAGTGWIRSKLTLSSVFETAAYTVAPVGSDCCKTSCTINYPPIHDGQFIFLADGSCPLTLVQNYGQRADVILYDRSSAPADFSRVYTPSFSVSDVAQFRAMKGTTGGTSAGKLKTSFDTNGKTIVPVRQEALQL
tara:strand:+ start:543 stop:1295 length:753 start_codon:yes stop_codon:yes gene_type:complete